MCVCTVLDHERRGSLPTTCSCNFTCEFSSRGATAHLSTLPNEAKRDVVEAEWDAVLCTCTAAPCGADD